MANKIKTVNKSSVIYVKSNDDVGIYLQNAAGEITKTEILLETVDQMFAMALKATPVAFVYKTDKPKEEMTIAEVKEEFENVILRGIVDSFADKRNSTSDIITENFDALYRMAKNHNVQAWEPIFQSTAERYMHEHQLLVAEASEKGGCLFRMATFDEICRLKRIYVVENLAEDPKAASLYKRIVHLDSELAAEFNEFYYASTIVAKVEKEQKLFFADIENYSHSFYSSSDFAVNLQKAMKAQAKRFVFIDVKDAYRNFDKLDLVMPTED